MASFTSDTPFFQHQGKRKAFILLFLIGLVFASAQLFKSYVINSGYFRPSPLMVYPILFEYLAFSCIAFLFPWSWPISQNVKKGKFVLPILTGLGFVLLYLFIVSVLEWWGLEKTYQFWPAYLFTLRHSGLLILIVYVFVSGLLYVLGVPKMPMQPAPTYLERIPIKIKQRHTYLPVSEIQLLEANDNYISLYMDNRQHHLIRNTLSAIEPQLNPQQFQRIHRKYIVNLERVVSWQVDPNGGYVLFLSNGSEAKVSKTYKDKIVYFTQG